MRKIYFTHAAMLEKMTNSNFNMGWIKCNEESKGQKEEENNLEGRKED